MALSGTLPTSLNDLFVAPDITDGFGNRLYSNWSVSFPSYRFNVSRLEAIRMSYYQAQAAWPNLYNFTGNIIENVETTSKAKSFLRRLIIGATENDPGFTSSLISGLLEYKSLLTAVVIGLILSFIVVPIAAAVTYRCVKKRFRDNFLYNRYSSDSLATATAVVNDQHNNKVGSQQQGPASSSYSHGLVAAIVLAVVCGLFATFGLGASFYFNNSFSFSLFRTTTVIANATNDISAIGKNFIQEFGAVGDVVMDDLDRKMAFVTKATDSLGSAFGDQMRVLDLLQKSQGILLFFMLLSWEKSTMEPLAESLEASLDFTRRLGVTELNLTGFRNDRVAMENLHALCTVSYNSSTTTCTRTTPAWAKSNGNSTTINLCNTCLVPEIPASIDPMFLSHFTNRQLVGSTIDMLANQTRKMMSTKIGQMITREDLIRQFNGIKDVFSRDFHKWIDHYKHWFNVRITVPLIDGDDSNCALLTGLETTHQLPNKNASKPSPTPRSNRRITTMESTVNGGIENNKSTSPSSQSADMAKVLSQAQDVFADRNYVSLVLLIIAAIQLALMMVGSLFLLVACCRGAGHSRSFRTRQASILENVGCTCVFAGSIIFVAFTGPLLCLLATAHFYAGGFIEKTICHAVKSGDHKLLDEMLNTDDQSNGTANILRYVLPPCISSLIDSVDGELLGNRLTIGKFLTAARNGQTLNELLMLNDTLFIRDVKNLTYLKLSSNFVVYNAKMQAYMSNLTRLTSSRAVFDRMVAEVDLNRTADLDAMLNTCSSCVMNSVLLGTSLNLSAHDANFDQQLDDAMRYKGLLADYVAALPDAQMAWSDSAHMLATTDEQEQLIIQTMRFVESYFHAILELLKDELSYMITQLVDNLSQGITSDIGQLQVVYELYQGLVGEYACVELVGSMNAFWFFLGIYLFFSTITAVLLIGAYAALISKKNYHSFDSDCWKNRQSPVSRKLPVISPSTDSFEKIYPLPTSNNKFSPNPILASLGSYRNKGYVNDSNNDSAESYIMGSVISEAAAQEILQETMNGNDDPLNNCAAMVDVQPAAAADNDSSDLEIGTNSRSSRQYDDMMVTIDDDDKIAINTTTFIRKS